MKHFLVKTYSASSETSMLALVKANTREEAIQEYEGSHLDIFPGIFIVELNMEEDFQFLPEVTAS